MPLREDFSYLRFPREGDTPHRAGLHGKVPGSGQEAEAGARGKLGPGTSLAFSCERQSGAG